MTDRHTDGKTDKKKLKDKVCQRGATLLKKCEVCEREKA